MKQFDYIIAGGGAAGLTLAFLLTGYEDKQKSILIIDRDAKRDNDRTWCFWEKETNLFEKLIYKSWPLATIKTSNWSQTYTLAPYTYKMIRGIDFYDFMKAELTGSNIQWVQDEIISIDNDGTVTTKTGVYKGQLVFDSTFKAESLTQTNANTILQHFKGWIVETEQAHFDSNAATYMDFSIDQQADCRFGYVLPFTQKKALVEYTLFNKKLLTHEEYDSAIKDYLTKLGISQYHVSEVECGVIPMTDHRFKIRRSDHVFNIGINGGFAKASTGYSFLRAQHILKKMAENIVLNQPPDLDLPFQANRFKLYDATLLKVLDSGKFTGEDIFGSLFRKNGVHAMFKFLDEETSLAEELKIMSSAPLMHFGKAFLQQLGK